jgi:hypothetical protein
VVEQATHRAEAFAARYATLFPAAVPCITDTLAELTVHLRFPREHWRGIRHSNFIERTFGETRRGIKVIGRLPGETSCLLLVWAVLDPASGGFRGVTQRPAGVRLLQDLRRQLLAGDGPVSSQGRWSTGLSPPPPSIRQWSPRPRLSPEAGRHRGG